ncbi:MAG: DUF342 domain-containing protein [Proteobacteria bacterium]|nr:DUF342 domain-containing protein [Pseudomonadota bacterium]
MIGLVVEQQFTIFITENKLCAYLELLPAPESELEPLSLEYILNILKTSKMSTDINESLISDTLQQFYSNNIIQPPLLIAQGKKPQSKQEQGLHWLIDPLSQHEYERVIAPDFAIGYEVCNQQGYPGIDIFGEVIESLSLPDMTISEGDAVYKKIIKDEQGNDQAWYYSHYLGIVNLSDDVLSVQSLIEVDKDSPFEANINVYGFLGDEIHTKVTSAHIMETLKRMEISQGWDAQLLIKVQHLARRRQLSELQQDVKKSLLLLLARKPLEAEYGQLEWVVKKGSDNFLDKIIAPGQIIARYKCIFAGEDGTDVYGNTIAPEDQSALFPAVGKYIELSKTETHYNYRAQTLGLLETEEDISLKSLIEITEDKLFAYFNIPIFPKKSDSRVISLSQIQTTLEYEFICYGLVEETLQKIVSQIQLGKQGADEDSYLLKTLVAEGKAPIDGIDANIELNKKISAGKLMKNGRIDFKERSYPWDVKNTDEIGHIIPLVPEVNGIDVYNQAIIAKKPEDIELLLDGLHRTDDGHIISDRDGTLIVRKTTLTVTDSIVLDGNIDNVTGNVKTDSTMIVKGYVDPGFRLETTADICIDANIENAVTKAEGNIIIRGGVRGNDSLITAGGEVNVTFMEHAQVYSQESIIIGDNLIDCEIHAMEEVIVGEDESTKSSIVGGRVHAQKKISAGNLGNEINIKTEIMVGYSKDEQNQFYDLSEQIKAKQKELEHIEGLYGSSGTEQGNMAHLVEKIAALKVTMDEQKQQQTRLKKLMLSGVNSTVEFYNSAYPGVTITICGNSLKLKEVYKRGKFYLIGKRVKYQQG